MPQIPYWRLSGFYFLFFITVGVFLPYWPLYLKSIGLDAQAIGILSAVVVLTKIFAAYPWGWVVDHTGRRMQVIQFASFLSALTFSSALFIQGFWGLIVVLFLFSIFWSASLPQIEAATLAHLGESTHTYTTIRVWGSIGFIFSVWLLGLVFEWIDISNVPLIMLGSMVIVWLMSVAIHDLRPEQRDHTFMSLKETLLRSDVLALLVVCFLMLASHGPYYTFYSIYLETNGYSSAFIGGMWALGVIAEVILFMFMHRLISAKGLRVLFLSSLLLAAVRWLLIGYFAENIFFLVIAQLLHAATFGVYHAVAIQYIHRFFRGHLQGRGQALYSSTSFGAGMAAGSLISGYTWEKVGALSCFQGAAAMALLAMIVAWCWLRE